MTNHNQNTSINTVEKNKDTSLDRDTEQYLHRIGQKYYHHLLAKRHKAGRFLDEGTTEEIPGWPYPYTKESK